MTKYYKFSEVPSHWWWCHANIFYIYAADNISDLYYNDFAAKMICWESFNCPTAMQLHSMQHLIFIPCEWNRVPRVTEVWDMQLWPEEFHERPSVASH